MLTRNFQRMLLTGLRMSLSAAICYSITSYFNWPEGLWAVVTCSAITRPNLSGTFVKAILRIAGTLLGASVGFVCATFIFDSPLWLFFIFFIFSTATTYIALQTRPYNYAAVVAGFTAVIIISSKILGDVEALALYRTVEVGLGIIVTGLVSFTFVSGHLPPSILICFFSEYFLHLNQGVFNETRHPTRATRLRQTCD